MAHKHLKIELDLPDNVGIGNFSGMIDKISLLIKAWGIEEGTFGNQYPVDDNEITGKWKITHVPDPEPTDPDL